ncbi:MAG: PD-(D/E)XK nuclease domain-containing protein, partial [Methanobrevibacter sp.]|nr:PD-(D/E)XK nuclease domain-containing protein [Methanobrevibacter sp.]
MKKNEAYYHVIIILLLKLFGFEVQGEIITLKGRVDAVLTMKNLVVIIEFKYSTEKSLNIMLKEALKQIHDTGYYKPYLDKKIMLLPIAIKEKDIKC